MRQRHGGSRRRWSGGSVAPRPLGYGFANDGRSQCAPRLCGETKNRAVSRQPSGRTDPEQFEQARPALPRFYAHRPIAMGFEILACVETPDRTIIDFQEGAAFTDPDDPAQAQRRLARAHRRRFQARRPSFGGHETGPGWAQKTERDMGSVMPYETGRLQSCSFYVLMTA